MVGIIEVEGLGKAEKNAKEILEHVQAIRSLQYELNGVNCKVVLRDEEKEETTSGS